MDLFYPLIEAKHAMKVSSYHPNAMQTLLRKVVASLWPQSIKSALKMVKYPILGQNVIT